MQLALDRDVLLVVGIQLRSQLRRIDPIEFGWVFVAPRLARLPHDADDLLPDDVLSVHQTKNLGDAFETAGIGMRERQRHRADVPIDRHHWPAMLRNQDAFEDRALERRVMCDPGQRGSAAAASTDLGDRLSWDPGLDRAVAAGVADAQHFGSRMLGVGAGADALLPLPNLAALRLSISQWNGVPFSRTFSHDALEAEVVSRSRLLGSNTIGLGISKTAAIGVGEGGVECRAMKSRMLIGWPPE